MKKILVPSDFSANATNSVKYAIKFASATGKQLVFSHVTHADIPTSNSHSTYLHKVDAKKKESLLHLQDYISNIYKELDLLYEEDKVLFDVRFGHSAQEKIVEAAEELNVETIIMGTQGASGLKKIFVGSNTTAVLKNVSCSVLVVPNKAQFEGIKSIGYSSNLEKLDDEVDRLIPLASMLEAKLDIFNVYPVYPSNIDYSSLSVESLLSEQKSKYENINLTIIHRAEENDLEGGINAFVKSHKPDLLVMFSQSRNWFESLINSSATESIAFDPKVPLLSFKA